MPNEDNPFGSPYGEPPQPSPQQPEQFGATHSPAPDAQFHRPPPSEGDPASFSGPAMPGDARHGTSPALRRPRWSGKKTAVVAALAIGLSSAGAIGAAAASPAGQSGSGTGRQSPGGFGWARNRGGTGTQLGPGGAGAPGGSTGGQGGTTGQVTTNGTTTST